MPPMTIRSFYHKALKTHHHAANSSYSYPILVGTTFLFTSSHKAVYVCKKNIVIFTCTAVHPYSTQQLCPHCPIF